MNTLPRVIEAAKLTHAHHFIQDLPHGYDTMIGPLGHYLKPDEQFRIALARAYLHDPSILIVEEPNQPMDSDTKHFIDDTLARLSIGRTLIMIPHRLSSVRASDHVIVLHERPGRGRGLARPAPDREQALPPPGLQRVQRVRDRRDRGRPDQSTRSRRCEERDVVSLSVFGFQRSLAVTVGCADQDLATRLTVWSDN